MEKKIKVKPKRLTIAERKSAKRAQKASEQLELLRQNGAFHKAYLEIELDAETAKHEAIQARIAELSDPETLETVTEETDMFDELEQMDEDEETFMFENDEEFAQE